VAEPSSSRSLVRNSLSYSDLHSQSQSGATSSDTPRGQEHDVEGNHRRCNENTHGGSTSTSPSGGFPLSFNNSSALFLASERRAVAINSHGSTRWHGSYTQDRVRFWEEVGQGSARCAQSVSEWQASKTA
jgi:hypothetical protein